MPKLCSLPPTDQAFMEKLERAQFQICIWKHLLDLNVPDLDLQYGWTKDIATKSLVAFMCSQIMTLPSVTFKSL